MLSQFEQSKKKWVGSHNAIDVWLHERQDLLVKYCELAGIPPYQRKVDGLPDLDSIRLFCEILMDYISAGHFEVYDKIIAETSDTTSSKSLADRIYPQIALLTEEALAFNDEFAEANTDRSLETFDINLSKLGQNLMERFELEDELIHSLHSEALLG
ncbi:sigma D regulator [Aliiglaciecola sp. LCG003]|uniref:sigma D regulator n=1 Tax=Aliiglaciecola sp. LCG003 TaxID=3053655 RepID=UPI002572908B|nr:sigma D regulator [Aliiglaciecola sp. LCG003]WJG09782.1 sigma D regulator [Aliiglaciecola sp. LCG003]